MTQQACKSLIHYTIHDSITSDCSVLEGLGLVEKSNLSGVEKEAVEIELKYAGFVKRQQRELLQMEAQQSRKLPVDLDYQSIPTMSLESREKLSKVGLLMLRLTCSSTSLQFKLYKDLMKILILPLHQTLLAKSPSSIATNRRTCVRNAKYPAFSFLTWNTIDVDLQVRPANVGQASRIGGVNPVDITNLLVYLEVNRQKYGGDSKPNISEKERRKALVKSAMATSEESRREVVHA